MTPTSNNSAVAGYNSPLFDGSLRDINRDEIRRAFRLHGEMLGTAADVPRASAEDDRETRCTLCGDAPADSGAQYDMAEVTWNGIAGKVCSLCIDARPASIADLRDAFRRAEPVAATHGI